MRRAAAQPRRRLSAGFPAPPAYGWRADPAVPAFPDDGPLILFDGVCVLCSAFARFVAARDGGCRFRFVAAQSRLGQALLAHAGLDPADPQSNLLIADGGTFVKIEAITGVLDRLGPSWWLLAHLMRIIPRDAANWLYDRVAQNRMRLFGRRKACVVPDASWRGRLLGDDAA